MRVAFFGTPDVAVACLAELLASTHVVVAAVTQPDRPRGRRGTLVASPVKQLATQREIPVLQPHSPRADDFAAQLSGFAPDALAVVAYGHILPGAVLEVAPAVNVHFSLLPAYRGAAPVQRALLDGATETGVSVFLLEPTVDTGPVVASERVDIQPEETAGELLSRLTPIGARLLIAALDGLAAGEVRAHPQPQAGASSAPKITQTDARIDWSGPAARVTNLVRAMNPAPGAWTTLRGKRLLVWRARSVEGSGPPGEVVDPMAAIVAAGQGAVQLLELQLEGKRRMSAEEFVRGRGLAQGDRLGA